MTPVDSVIIDDIYHPMASMEAMEAMEAMEVDMRYSAQHKQETGERRVQAASRTFRCRGGDGVAIADLMRKLNLTHGGFYRHFDSKEQLFAEAVAKSFEDVRARFKEVVEKAPPEGRLKVFIEQY